MASSPPNKRWRDESGRDGSAGRGPKASKGRRSKPAVASFEYNLEAQLIDLRDELHAKVPRA